MVVLMRWWLFVGDFVSISQSRVPRERKARRMETPDDAGEKRIDELRERIRDLTARLPKHSVPMAMLIELEDLEEDLAALEAEAKAGSR